MAKVLIQRSLRLSFVTSRFHLSSPIFKTSPSLVQVTPVISFHKSSTLLKKGKSKSSKPKPQISDVIDQMEIDEVDEDEEEDFAPKKETELRKYFSSKSKGKKPTKGSSNITYEDFMKIVNGEVLWKELESQLNILKDIYTYQLSVRSATSLGKF